MEKEKKKKRRYRSFGRERKYINQKVGTKGKKLEMKIKNTLFFVYV